MLIWQPSREGVITRENLKSRIDIWTSPDFKFSIEKKNLDVSVIQIWTSPDLKFSIKNFKSGQVQILNIQLINKNLDKSEFFFSQREI